MTAQDLKTTTTKYIGSELELFASATVWKTYLRSQIQPFMGKNVIEVGAGLGGTTRIFCSEAVEKWLCVEPDAELAIQLKTAISAEDLPSCCEVVDGTLESISRKGTFETVLYIDVLEHIADDRAELELAIDYLKPSGHLVVLAPAHQWLFTPFDEAIGHFRRYSKKSLSALKPKGSRLAKLVYLDSVGLLASLSNKILLRQADPTPPQIAIWDKWMVRCSRILDPLLLYGIGKSVLAIWEKKADC